MTVEVKLKCLYQAGGPVRWLLPRYFALETYSQIFADSGELALVVETK